MSEIGLAVSRSEEATASANADEAAAEGREHKSALLELLEVCVCMCACVCVCVCCVLLFFFVTFPKTVPSGPVLLKKWGRGFPWSFPGVLFNPLKLSVSLTSR